MSTLDKAWKLNPSDFAFLWEECRRCFYLKVVQGTQRPRLPMPKIFTMIDLEMKVFLGSRRLEVVGAPSGVLQFTERWVESLPIAVPGHSTRCYLRGRFDLAAALDDATYAVVDLKTASVKDQYIPLYCRQLWAYAWALENAAPGKPILRPVSRLGLLVFEPAAFFERRGIASLAGDLCWIEVKRDDTAFLAFLDEVLSVLEQPDPPLAVPSCEWCRWTAAA